MPTTTLRISPRYLESASAAASQITADFGVILPDFTRFFSRIKNLLRLGLLDARQSQRGKRTNLTPKEFRRLKWAALLTSCDITPAAVVRMMRDMSDEQLAPDWVAFVLQGDLHAYALTIRATLPARCDAAIEWAVEGVGA